MTRTPNPRALRFSQGGNAAAERVYRTNWVSLQLSGRKRERLAERLNRPPDLVVICPLKKWTCQMCGGTGDLLLVEAPGSVCLDCADLSHLVLLPSGNAALTRRARKASGLSAVVVRFSRARKRYERQGLLVEEAALEQAEAHCLTDEEARSRHQERDAARRAGEDGRLPARIAEEIARRFPGCPPERVRVIARHATVRVSGRVGSTIGTRGVDVGVVEEAVAASVRHHDTRYDRLLMAGVGPVDARAHVHNHVAVILDSWRPHPVIA